MSLEQKLTISNSLRGITFSSERKQRISESLKGRKLSDEHKKNISISLKGNPKLATNKGKFGEESHGWKGDKAGYFAIHNWIRKHKPKKGICEDCKKTCKTEFHSINEKYTRNINDYRELCNSCHKRTRGLV